MRGKTGLSNMTIQHLCNVIGVSHMMMLLKLLTIVVMQFKVLAVVFPKLKVLCVSTWYYHILLKPLKFKSNFNFNNTSDIMITKEDKLSWSISYFLTLFLDTTTRLFLFLLTRFAFLLLYAA